jgi:putative spermidine/putrescine transport system ATP-binding protein
MHATLDTALTTPAVRFAGVARHFGAVKAVDGVDLAIAPSELVALLGPSGSGKTTLLRIVAGLEQPSGGRVLFDGADALSVPVRRRGIGFVFQNYALFRHMNVAENIAFGLRSRPRAERPSEAEIGKRVDELLALVQLEGYGGRFPAQLSGGQRQRVALARALAIEPKVLLLDEPFGALDALVRKELRKWLRELHDRTGHTTLFVTHDQEEALELADRVAVFNDGRIVQVGPPEEVYERPATRFVAGFVGSSNVLSALEAEALGGLARPSSLRPEKIALVTGAPPEGAHAVEATVVDVSYQGPVRRITARTPAGLVLTAAVSAGAAGEVERGGKVMLAVPPDALQPMEGEA